MGKIIDWRELQDVGEAHPNLPPRSVEAPQKCPLQAAKIQGALALIIAYRTAEGSKVGKSPWANITLPMDLGHIPPQEQLSFVVKGDIAA